MGANPSNCSRLEEPDSEANVICEFLDEGCLDVGLGVAALEAEGEGLDETQPGQTFAFSCRPCITLGYHAWSTPTL